jgi:PIN domain nuclease of toxin-antitoxin system
MIDAPALLLDTHVWVWLMTGTEDKLSLTTLERIDQASRAGHLKVSAISVWEVAMLEARGRIKLNQDCLQWVRRALSQPGTELVPLSPEIAVSSTRLPADFHGDPADRILVATARERALTLVTQDAKILDYGARKYLRVMPAA